MNIITTRIRIRITANIIFEASDADPRTQRNTYTMNNMAEKQTLTKQKLNNKRKMKGIIMCLAPKKVQMYMD